MTTSRIDHRTHELLERSVGELDLQGYVDARLRAEPPRPYHQSPVSWQDQVLYFLMVDRFSNQKERGSVDSLDPEGGDAYLDNDGERVGGGQTPPFDPGDAYGADRSAWAAAGRGWCGGTLKGVQTKLGYLKRLGVSAIWLSPVFKQVERTFDPRTAQLVDNRSYHGYGTQNFLDVDPRFGTRRDLQELVAEAHRLNIYVVLDVVLNHAGDVFEYDADRYPCPADSDRPFGVNPRGDPIMEPRWDGSPYEVRNYRDASGEAVVPFGPVDLATHPDAWPHAALWPTELQPSETFSQKGCISNYDHAPEYFEGDFQSLKDIHHGHHDRDADGNPIIHRFHPSAALKALSQAFKFWIAFADVDGFRVDTVKHMEKGATRYFASVIHEFAQSIGKENFFLLGEVTGSRNEAIDTVRVTGLDAAIGIADVAELLEYLPKGYRDPRRYFDLFANSADVGEATHTWFGKRVVTMFDDHDKVGRAKRRFCGDKVNSGQDFVVSALALNLTTLGIPCIYYGTEQAFDGDARGENEDRYLRECMFGAPFGSFQSAAGHFFNEHHPVYRIVSEITALQKGRIELRRGRQYPREISATGEPHSYGFPHMVGGQLRSVVPWSRIFSDRELLLAINTDARGAREAWVRIDNFLHSAEDRLVCLYSTDEAMLGTTITVEQKDGAAVYLTVPAAGFVIYE